MTDPIPADLMPAPIGSDDLGTAIDAFHADGGAQTWRITDEGAAEWCCRKLAAVRREIDEAEERAAEWHAQVNQWLADRTHGARRSAEFFEAQLRNWALANRDEHRKSFVLPSARVKTRAGSVIVEVSDETAFVEWARKAERFDLLSLRASKSAIKETLNRTRGGAFVDADGEIVPGIHAVEGQPTATVEVTS